MGGADRPCRLSPPRSPRCDQGLAECDRVRIASVVLVGVPVRSVAVRFVCRTRLSGTGCATWSRALSVAAVGAAVRPGGLSGCSGRARPLAEADRERPIAAATGVRRHTASANHRRSRVGRCECRRFRPHRISARSPRSVTVAGDGNVPCRPRGPSTAPLRSDRSFARETASRHRTDRWTELRSSR